jgi:hypothetical protein
MSTSELSHKEIFDFLKSQLPNDEVTITHPLNNSDITKGIVTVLALGNVLAGKFINQTSKGLDIQLSLYHYNFALINDLNQKVRTAALNFYPSNQGNTEILKELSPKFINYIGLWQSVIIIRWYFEEILS